MSGYQRPRYGVGRGRMQLPRPTYPPVAAPIDSAFQMLEIADTNNLKVGQEAQIPSLLLTDSNHVTWRVTVNTDGTLNTAKVPPR